MDLEVVNKIKRIAIIALASDESLIEEIVLKGGNAIDIAYYSRFNLISRTSYDLDFSIAEGDFNDDELIVDQRIKRVLEQTFLEHSYVVIDYKFISKPKKVREDVADFWGGYKVEFKVIEEKKFNLYKDNPERRSRSAVALKPDLSPVFEIEFSKFEYVGIKAEIHLDGYTIYVYTPEMIVFEKLRAICQQLPQYQTIIKSRNSSARARDFYDIHLVMEKHSINPDTNENKEMIRNVFSSKRVPLDYIKEIKNHKYIHKDDWNKVKATVPQSEELQDFDFYFDYVIDKFEHLTFL